jgi:hypothetical protein
MTLERAPVSGLVSMFSENRKEGRWQLPPHMRVLAIFGNAYAASVTIQVKRRKDRGLSKARLNPELEG